MSMMEDARRARRMTQYAIRQFTVNALKDEEFELTVPTLEDVSAVTCEEGIEVCFKHLPLQAKAETDFTTVTNYIDEEGNEQIHEEKEFDLYLLVNGVVNESQIYNAPIIINVHDMTIEFKGVDSIKRSLREIESIDDIDEHHYGFQESDFDLESIEMDEIRVKRVAKLYPFKVELPEYLINEED